VGGLRGPSKVTVERDGVEEQENSHTEIGAGSRQKRNCNWNFFSHE